MSIDRFHPFTDAELAELRYGLKFGITGNALAGRHEDSKSCQGLSDEIAHVQEQREMARRREELPG